MPAHIKYEKHHWYRFGPMQVQVWLSRPGYPFSFSAEWNRWRTFRFESFGR